MERWARGRGRARGKQSATTDRGWADCAAAPDDSSMTPIRLTLALFVAPLFAGWAALNSSFGLGSGWIGRVLLAAAAAGTLAAAASPVGRGRRLALACAGAVLGALAIHLWAVAVVASIPGD